MQIKLNGHFFLKKQKTNYIYIVYIYSHFHSDHYRGLNSSWKHGQIYCSSVTGNLVIQNLKVNPKYVHKLPMNKRVQIEDHIGLSVTLIDANQ